MLLYTTRKYLVDKRHTTRMLLPDIPSHLSLFLDMSRRRRTGRSWQFATGCGVISCLREETFDWASEKSLSFRTELCNKYPETFDRTIDKSFSFCTELYIKYAETIDLASAKSLSFCKELYNKYVAAFDTGLLSPHSNSRALMQ